MGTAMTCPMLDLNNYKANHDRRALFCYMDELISGGSSA